MLTVKPESRQNLPHGRDHRHCASDKARLPIGGSEIVRVVYSDETGLGGSEEPITVATAIMLNMDSQWDPLEAAIEESLLKAMSAERAKRYEIKGKNLFYDVRKKRLKSEQLLIDLLLIAEQHKIPIAFAAVDRAGYEQIFHNSDLKRIYGLAFYEHARHIDDYTHFEITKEKLLWIADKSKAELRLKEGLADFRAMRLVDMEKVLADIGGSGLAQTVGTAARNFPEPHIAHLADTIYFGDSKESRALQLADVYSSTITRALNGDALGRKFYPLIRPQIIRPMPPMFMQRALSRSLTSLLYR
jgi:Protein of unknown function (DUF3800)